jgi:hypothetical protein
LSPERVLVGLAPGEISLVRARGLFREKTLEQRTLACDPAFGPEPWQGAVAALKSLELSGRVIVVLANHFVRYAVIPWSDALSTAAEEEAYVRHHFARIHGERAKSWALRAAEDRRGAARLASAIDNALIEELKKAFPKGGKASLVSVQPQLMAAINRWRTSIPASGAWLLLAEPDRACLALNTGNQWRSVQNAKGSWLTLLERERHRVEGEVPDLVLLAGAPAPRESGGWKFRELPA